MDENNKSEVKSVAVHSTGVSQFRLLVLVFIISAVAGTGSAWLLTQHFSKKIVVVDVEKIINKRKDEFTKKYSHRDVGDESARNEMSGDIKEFADKMEKVLSDESADKIILSKGSVVSNLDDITDPVINQIWGK